MKHELTEIHTKENSFLVDRNSEIKTGDYFFANEGVRKCIRVDANTNCPYITLDEKGREIGHFNTWKTKIIASTHRIDPSVPLYHPEDLKVKERYSIQFEPKEHVWGVDTYKVFDMAEGYGEEDAIFRNESKAQEYCNYLNRQHEVADVGALEKEIADKAQSLPRVKSNHYPSLFDSITDILAGYKAATKHGWSDEDMLGIAGFAFGINKSVSLPEAREMIENYIKELKNQPRTITLEYDEKPEVGDDGYIIVK